MRASASARSVGPIDLRRQPVALCLECANLAGTRHDHQRRAEIAPIEKSTPPETDPGRAPLPATLPRIRITDLLSEVATWTLFPDCFTHLRTGETAADSRILMAGLLADGLNLGLTRMAEVCSIASLSQLARTLRLAHPRRNLSHGAAVPGQPATA